MPATRLKTLEGYLSKKSPNIFHGWQKRWCVLENRIFSFYETKDASYPNGVINFDQLSVKVHPEDDKLSFTLIPANLALLSMEVTRNSISRQRIVN